MAGITPKEIGDAIVSRIPGSEITHKEAAEQYDIKAQTKTQLQSTTKELSDTRKNLKRKNDTLTETAALLTLSKKARSLWGDKEN